MIPYTQACLTRTVVIVDPVVDDYDALAALHQSSCGRFVFVDTGEAALQLPTPPYPVWLINVNLPDIPGPDLIRALRERSACPIVCLIGDGYDARDELEARCCGAALYLCKPLSPHWFVSLSVATPADGGRIFELAPRPPTRCRDRPPVNFPEDTLQTPDFHATQSPLYRRQGADHDEHPEHIVHESAQRRVTVADGGLRRHTDTRVDRP